MPQVWVSYAGVTYYIDRTMLAGVDSGTNHWITVMRSLCRPHRARVLPGHVRRPSSLATSRPGSGSGLSSGLDAARPAGQLRRGL
jgi:hypothetical protein